MPKEESGGWRGVKKRKRRRRKKKTAHLAANKMVEVPTKLLRRRILPDKISFLPSGLAAATGFPFP